MINVLITGSNGFIGKNLTTKLKELGNFNILPYDVDNNPQELEEYIIKADFIFHLAGVNRPENIKEFYDGNAGFTGDIISTLNKLNKKIPLVITSSIQVELDNDYGKSKKQAEDFVVDYSNKNKTPVYIFRLPNVFGKWCKPNYNSAVATFCYNISHDIDVWVSDETKELNLVYIDDVVDAFIEVLENKQISLDKHFYSVSKVYKKTLGEIVHTLTSFRKMRNTLLIPDMSDEFKKVLYSTYLSYLDEDKFSYALDKKEDNRGWLAEMVKSPQFGQMFVSKSHEGILRGNHYHHTKVEKFIVIQGEALISFRKIDADEVIEYRVSGERPEVVDIPPGYTHSIENIGEEKLITLFWANEMFNQNKPDTIFNEVRIHE